MSIDENYLRGYLDGLCDKDGADVWYDEESDEWVTDNNNRRICISCKSVHIYDGKEEDGYRYFPLSDVDEVMFADNVVRFKVTEVI